MMAENRETRSATDMASQRINAANDPEQAVSAALGAAKERAEDAAPGTAHRLVQAARGFAMEVSEALFGSKEPDDEEEKI